MLIQNNDKEWNEIKWKWIKPTLGNWNFKVKHRINPNVIKRFKKKKNEKLHKYPVDLKQKEK